MMMKFDVEPSKSKDLCWYWDKQQAMIALFRLLQAAWILALILLKLMVYRCVQLSWYYLYECMGVFFLFFFLSCALCWEL